MISAALFLLLQGAAPAPDPSVGFQLGGARPPAPPAGLPAAIAALPAFDCGGGLEGVVGRIRAIPNVEAAQPPPGSVFSAYRDPAKNMIYVISGPGMPAHPGVVRVTIVEVNGATAAAASACVFGNKDEAGQLVNQVRSMLGPPAPAGAAATSAPTAVRP